MIRVKCQEYEWIFHEDSGTLECTRNGLSWRDETGDGAILALMQRCVDLESKAE